MGVGAGIWREGFSAMSYTYLFKYVIVGDTGRRGLEEEDTHTPPPNTPLTLTDTPQAPPPNTHPSHTVPTDVNTLLTHIKYRQTHTPLTLTQAETHTPTPHSSHTLQGLTSHTVPSATHTVLTQIETHTVTQTLQTLIHQITGDACRGGVPTHRSLTVLRHPTGKHTQAAVLEALSWE